MFLEEADGKVLLDAAGITTPSGVVATTPEQAGAAAADIGPVMVKAQVPAGQRGKGGGIVAAATAQAARAAADELLGSELGGHRIDRVLVEAQVDIAAELYVAILIDPATAGPLLIASAQGGMDIEQVAASDPSAVIRTPIDIAVGLVEHQAQRAAAALTENPALQPRLASTISDLYRLFRRHDAQLVEVNPLAITGQGETAELVALDAKIVIDDNALYRQGDLPPARPIGTPLELAAADQDFLFVELDGDVGVLANGAGLTMSTMDAVTAHGGRPANFLEVGGMAYKRATPALALVLSNPKVKSLLVNLCGAYARTDVIAEGLIAGWHELAPDIPVAFCIHGTGEERAQQLVRDQLGVEPHDSMDDAIREAIAMAADRGRPA